MKDFKRYLEIIQEISTQKKIDTQKKRKEINDQIKEIHEQLKYKRIYKKFEDFSRINGKKFEKFADELESYAVSSAAFPEYTEFYIYVTDFKTIVKNEEKNIDIDYSVAFCKVDKTIGNESKIESQYFLGFYDNNKKENYVCYNDSLEKAIQEVKDFDEHLFLILSNKEIQKTIDKLTRTTGVSTY